MLDTAAQWLRAQGVETLDLAVVLGSGLGSFAGSLNDARSFPYSEIPSMPEAGVSGHAGELVVGELGTLRVGCLSGRVHAYEGHSPDKVVFGVRLLARLGCRFALLTNAAGGIQPGLVPGDLMLIRDHINLTGNNPLVGDAAGEPRFVDMTQAYDPAVSEAGLRAGLDVSVDLAQGVYAGMLGPSYETPAEVRMLRTVGADAVGMSTVWETLALNQLAVRVGAMSLITNLAAGLSSAYLSHEEVKEVAAVSATKMQAVLTRWVERIGDLART